MPQQHARKKQLAQLKTALGVKHADAIALLDHPDPDEASLLCGYLEMYSDITTYREAVAYLEQERSDPRNKVMCDRCGWTFGMVCPECPGCGCYNGECTGWRHSEFADSDDEHDAYGCQECGAGGSDPYGECCCYDEDEAA